MRWSLAALCAVLLLGILWWGKRRSAQSPGQPELREPTLTVTTEPPPEPRDFGPASRERRASPLEPLSIRTAEFEELELERQPMIPTLRAAASLSTRAPAVADCPSMEDSAQAGAVEAGAVQASAVQTGAGHTDSGEADSAEADSAEADWSAAPGRQAPPEPAPQPAAVAQRIVALRVSALKEAPWTGVDLMTALENHGMAHGRYQVFHRKHADGRTLFCAASLVEPGSFDLQEMPHQEFRGVSLFAILPGPLEPSRTLDAMLTAAHELARSLNGVVQDATGQALSPERAADLRREVGG